MFCLLLLESGRQAAAEAPTVGIAHPPEASLQDIPFGSGSACIGSLRNHSVEKRQLAELEVVLHADKPDLRNLAAMYGTPIGPAAVMRSNERGEVNRPRRRELRACDSHALLNYPFILLRLDVLRHDVCAPPSGAGLAAVRLWLLPRKDFRQRKKLGDLFRNL